MVKGFRLSTFALFQTVSEILTKKDKYVTYLACVGGKLNAEPYEIGIHHIARKYRTNQEKNSLEVVCLDPIRVLLRKRSRILFSWCLLSPFIEFREKSFNIS